MYSFSPRAPRSLCQRHVAEWWPQQVETSSPSVTNASFSRRRSRIRRQLNPKKVSTKVAGWHTKRRWQFLTATRFSETYIKTTLGTNEIWSLYTGGLYAGSITSKVYLWGPVKCGLYQQVVFIYRWYPYIVATKENKGGYRLLKFGRCPDGYRSFLSTLWALYVQAYTQEVNAGHN